MVLLRTENTNNLLKHTIFTSGIWNFFAYNSTPKEYGQMEAAAQFSASNRFGNTRGSFFDCRLVRFLLTKENLGRNVFTS